MLTTVEPIAPQRSDWFASWFDSSHYHKLYAHRDETEAARFLDELMSRLRPRHGARVLDLGCGAGRHSRYLASKALRVTGMDLAAASIGEAKKSEQSRLRFLRHDMRVPFGRNVFDYVFNFFTSFGYFEEPGEHMAVVRNIATSLRDGGRLVLDYLNVRHAEARLTSEEVKEIDGVVYRLTRWTDADHFLQTDRGRRWRHPAARVRGARSEIHAQGLRAYVRMSPPDHRGGPRRLSPELV
jgi:SAM-dependent methyltransferase